MGVGLFQRCGVKVDRTSWPLGWAGWAVPFAALLAACGSATVELPPPTVDAASVDAASADVDGGEAGELIVPDAFAAPDSHPPRTCSTACPVAEPVLGTTCATYQTCTYGDEVRGCRTRLSCSAGVWVEDSNSTSYCASPASASACPTSVAAKGTPCTMPSLCAVPGGECQCQNSKWVCLTNAPGCPATHPNEGQPCANPNDTCVSFAYPCRTFFCACDVWGSVQSTCE
ncbi:hypothetical protein BH09MYX1_BH09MYX1_17940 [soil metagenome]